MKLPYSHAEIFELMERQRQADVRLIVEKYNASRKARDLPPLKGLN